MTVLESVWSRNLDRWALFAAALIPVGIAIGTTVFEALTVVVNLCWFASLAIRGSLSFAWEDSKPFWALVGWLATIWLSRIASPVASLHTWGHDFAFVRHLILVLALMDIASRLPVAFYLAWGLAAGIAWSAVNTALAFSIGYDLVGHPVWRYAGKLKEAGRIGALAAYAWPFMSLWAINIMRNDKRKFIWLSFLSLAAFALLLNSANRTAILAALAGLAFGCGYLLRHSRRKLIVFLVVCFCMAAVGAGVLRAQGINLRSFYDRVYYWKVSLALWYDNPVLGVGIGSFQQAYHAKATSGAVTAFVAPDGSVWNLPDAHHAHNLVLQLLACTGLLGLLAFIWLFYQLSRVALTTSASWKYGLATWPVVFLVIGLTGWNIFDAFYATIFSYLAALTAAGTARFAEPAPA